MRAPLLQACVLTAQRWLDRLSRACLPKHLARTPEPPEIANVHYHRLERVVLTDGVARTLFEEYAAHRASGRGEEETGWLLLGYRQENEAIALATLPAGSDRDAGVAHVQFNPAGQSLGSRIVRQADRGLVMVGVVHTHPGSLRHPSGGDYRGDSLWVQRLRGREGVFGIGTVREDGNGSASPADLTKPNIQRLGMLQFNWYALHEGDSRYRPLPVALTLGDDLAKPLHAVWDVIERHAERLEALVRQQASVRFEIVDAEKAPALAVTLPLAQPDSHVRILLSKKQTRFVLKQHGETMVADADDERVDRAVYLLLAELAA